MSRSRPVVPNRRPERTPATPSSRPDEYVEFCTQVRKLANVDLLQYKRGQMERRIQTFVGRRGYKELSAYLVKLKSDPEEVEAFLDRVTINVSQLWRNPEQWTAMARTVLPELARTGRLRAWSAGCSYGAEAYTLAAVCAETLPRTRVSIDGTDIDARMVARAREGRFSLEDARSAPKAQLEKWFEAEDGELRAKAALRKVVRFAEGDLLRMRFPRSAYDLVLCRNTVIYFNEEVRDALHARLVDALRPGGYLIVGSTERVAEARELGLNMTSPFTYRKS